MSSYDLNVVAMEIVQDCLAILRSPITIDLTADPVTELIALTRAVMEREITDNNVLVFLTDITKIEEYDYTTDWRRV